MANPSKAEWPPCATCGDRHGGSGDPGHLTPSRYDGEPLLSGMKPEERDRWHEAANKQVCTTCRNRFRQRMHRAERVSRGLTARIQPARLWKEPK